MVVVFCTPVWEDGSNEKYYIGNPICYVSSSSYLDHSSLFYVFRSIRNPLLISLKKMATGGYFGCPKITFNRIYRHFYTTFYPYLCAKVKSARSER